MLPLPPDPIWFPTGIVSAYPFIITADFFYSGHILGLSGCAMMAYSNGGSIYIYIYLDICLYLLFRTQENGYFSILASCSL